MPDTLSLGAFFHPTGHHMAAWRHPGAQVDAGTNIDHYLSLAKTAEAAMFDLVFLADAAAIRHGRLSELSRWPQYMAYFEPTTLLSAMAAVTQHIGLVATATTSFNEPYNIARRYASLDHISKGRAGWNVVTSSNQAEAQNFSRDAHFDHAERYMRAEEFVQIAKGLWDSWEDDAFLRDREAGLYFDPAKLHRLDHKGERFSVRGPLNVARPPQGHPVIVQAGASPAGRAFAAAHAEVIFTAQTDRDASAAFRTEMLGAAEDAGRGARALRIMPGLNPVVGETRAESQAFYDNLSSLVPPELGITALAPIVPEVDLSDCDPDKPIPLSLLPKDTNASKTDLARLISQTEAGMTLREIYSQFIGARGQNTVIGTAQDVADHIIDWVRADACDGFLIQPSVLPLGLDQFAASVVPLLQEAGVLRTEYPGATLRDTLGLERPANHYAEAGIANTLSEI
ncbi:MAG: LLM class flavin-dependent oxidoreductase [Pseudomonadota bacterium]|nr:LLM class flavin-dependent oxidoreductase [Pseudomonadota bacterium]